MSIFSVSIKFLIESISFDCLKVSIFVFTIFLIASASIDSISFVSWSEVDKNLASVLFKILSSFLFILPFFGLPVTILSEFK